MAMKDRGFGSMPKEKVREIARKGGLAAHQKGTAHEWTSAEASAAGKKGGLSTQRRKTAGADVAGVASLLLGVAASPHITSASEGK